MVPPDGLETGELDDEDDRAFADVDPLAVVVVGDTTGLEMVRQLATRIALKTYFWARVVPEDPPPSSYSK